MMQEKRLLFLVFLGGLLALSHYVKKPTPICKTPLQKQVKTTYTQIQKQYEPIINTIDTISFPTGKEELKKYVMLYDDFCNKKKGALSKLLGSSYQDLPFMQCKNILDKDIKKLKHYLRKLLKKKNKKRYYSNQDDVEKLITQLGQLNEAIITSEEYRQEKLIYAEKRSSPWLLRFSIGSLSRIIPI